MGLSVSFNDSYTNNCSEITFFSNLDMIMLKKWQGIHPISLSDNFTDNKIKQFLINTKLSQITLICPTKTSQ